MSVKKIDEKDIHQLSPCGARVIELLIAKLPELKNSAALKRGYAKEGEKMELDFCAQSPSGQLLISIETSPQAVELRLSQNGHTGYATAIFFMHPVNFHRTAEAAVDFLEKISLGQIIVARTKQRSFPVFGHKKLRFFDAGEIVGQKASEIEKVFLWKKLNT